MQMAYLFTLSLGSQEFVSMCSFIIFQIELEFQRDGKMENLEKHSQN